MKQFFIFLFVVLIVTSAYSQSIPVGNYAEQFARIYQIIGLSSDEYSFTQRPLNSIIYVSEDSVLRQFISGNSLFKNQSPSASGSVLKILLFNYLLDYNSKLPYGYNNEVLYPNVGFQTEVSSGIYFKTGILTVQLMPEFVKAQNRNFPTFEDIQGRYNTLLLDKFLQGVNGIDAPERFGNTGLSHFDIGQSKLTINLDKLEVGVSNENLWWGPGIQNSIMMSNSAPGFIHWTINTNAPIVSKIGSFEWQLIGGILKQSGLAPININQLAFFQSIYSPKPPIKRYLSAFTANYHPKWISGFYLGFSGYDYTNIDSSYHQNNILKKIIPVFVGPSGKNNNLKNANGGIVGDNQDYAYAVNFRQVFSEYNLELYGEYAKNDRFGSLRDLELEPEHATAYMVGGSRIFKLKPNTFLQIKMELTHLQIPSTFLVRDEPSWYIHTNDPRDGYTNEGRYLGAGIGPGSNSLMWDISYINGFNTFGIRTERFVHNNDLYYFSFTNATNISLNWVDISNTFYANVKFKNYLLFIDVTPVLNYNYEYSANKIFNLNFRSGITYYLE